MTDALQLPRARQINIRLRPSLDPSEPVLLVELLDGMARTWNRAVVITPHPVWHGAQLRKDYCRVVK